MVTDMTDRPSGRDETEDARLDRNLGELLQELRVALPGVQVLFAFLLAVPFQRNFTEISSFEEKVYFGTLLCTAISAALLISPSAYHRMTFHLQQKGHLVFLANRFAIAGLGLPGAGDDRGDHADHRRAVRWHRHRDRQRRGDGDVRGALVPAAAAAAIQPAGVCAAPARSARSPAS
jgi:hypothetical protein